MSKMRGAVVIDTDRCKGCNLCALAYMEQPGADACIGCASCAIVCPDGCITVYRKKED